MPPGDAAAFRKKFGIGPDKKIVLSLGRLSWKKGFDTLIPAFAAVAKEVPEAFLVLAGGDDENYKQTLEKLIDAAGVRDKVCFTGPLEGAEKSAAYEAAAVFALPSYAENFAITVAEAMHFGVPVVVSEEVGLAPDIKKAGAGLVIPKDAAACASAIIELLKDPARVRAMGARGRAFVAGELSYEKVAKDFLEAYRGACDGRAVPRKNN